MTDPGSVVKASNRSLVLLERGQDMDRLSMLLGAALGGEGGLAVVEGPAGIGKSSLLAATQASAEGFRPLRARGTELERAFSFGVVLQLLDPVVRAVSEAERGEVFSGAAGLVRQLFQPGATPVGPDFDKDFATLYGLYWLLAGLSERSPLLVVVDDLQWADEPSLRFLAFLVPRLEGLRVAVLAATRPQQAGAQSDLSSQLTAAAQLVIHPRPLSRAAISDLVQRRLATADHSLVEAVSSATGGNPFYVWALLEEVGQRSAPLSAGSIGELSPPTVSRAVLRRLAGLPRPATAVARAVAVLGDGATRGEVASLSGLSSAECTQAVDGLLAADVLSGGERLAYTHPIARAAVYGDLSLSAREDLHARAAQLRREAGAPTQQVAAQIMNSAPETVAGAEHVLDEAAGEALDRGAPEVAVTYWRRALLERLDDPRRAMIVTALAQASARAGLPEADADLRRAVDVAQADDQRAEAVLQLARLKTAMGRSDDAIEVLSSAAQQCAPGSGAVLQRLRAEILAIGDIDVMARQRAVAAADSIRSGSGAPVDPTLAAMLLAHDATTATMECRSADEAADLALRALSGGALMPAGVAGVQLSFLAAYFLGCADRFSEAEGFFDGFVDASRRAGSAAGFASASAWRSFVAFRRGDLAVAEAHARAGLETARSVGFQLVELTALSILCWTLPDRGETAAAAHELDQLAVDPRAIPTLQAAAVVEARGRVRLASGDTAGGVADLTEAGHRITASGLDNPASFPWRSSLAQGLATLGRRDEALSLIRDEVALARRWGAPRALGPALRVEGMLTDGPEGIERLREAVTVLDGSPALLERGRALIELGAASRRAGNRREARPLLSEGLEHVQACGAVPDAARARTELKAAGGRARTPARTGLDALTPSEQRIASLAAGGRTNPQIAQDLFVTIKTVEMHLSAVYRKLNVSSRSDLFDALAPAP